MVGVARLLDIFAFPTPGISQEELFQPASLWRITLSRLLLAAPLGVLRWGVFRQRPAFVLGIA